MKEKIGISLVGTHSREFEKILLLIDETDIFELKGYYDPSIQEPVAYRDAYGWRLSELIPESCRTLSVQPFTGELTSSIVITHLTEDDARRIEPDLAREGHFVLSLSGVHNLHPDIPLLIPEINADHISLVHLQSVWKGKLFAIPGIHTIGPVLVLSSLHPGIHVAHVALHCFEPYHSFHTDSHRMYPFDLLSSIHPPLESRVFHEIEKILGWVTQRRIASYPIDLFIRCMPYPHLVHPFATCFLFLEHPLVEEEQLFDEKIHHPVHFGMFQKTSLTQLVRYDKFTHADSLETDFLAEKIFETSHSKDRSSPLERWGVTLYYQIINPLKISFFIIPHPFYSSPGGIALRLAEFIHGLFLSEFAQNHDPTSSAE